MPAAPTAHTAPRVCFVAPFGLGQKTTVWARTLPLAAELARRGWQALLAIPPWDTPADAGKRWQQDGVTLANVALSGGLPATTCRLLHEIRRFQPDIVHIVKPRAHAGLVQWLLWQMPRGRRPALCLDLDDWEQAWAPINAYPPPVARFLAWQEEWGIRHADAITTASRWLEAKARVYNPGAPVCYLPNGITPVSHEIANGEAGLAPRSSPLVLFFTRFVEVTPAWLGAFWQALHTLAPAARLVMAGAPVQPGLDAPFRAALNATAPSAAERRSSAARGPATGPSL